MRRICLLLLATSLAGGALAQDLDTVTLVDRLDSGSRGNELGSGTWGAAAVDGSEFLDYSGTDATVTPTTAIRYINTWAAGNSNPESPVVTVTAPMDQTDHGLTGTIPAIPANPNSPSGSGDTAIMICDDGGFNSLFFGDHDDSDYYIEVDVYLWDQGTVGGFEATGIGSRVARDDGTSITEYSWCIDRTGGYSIFYDAMFKEVKAVRWITGNSSAIVTGRDSNAYVQFGDTIFDVTEGWHTMKIEARHSRIEFSFDGTVIANVEDSTFSSGRPGIYYRENGVDNNLERPGLFDNLRAGPATLVSGVADWTVY